MKEMAKKQRKEVLERRGVGCSGAQITQGDCTGGTNDQKDEETLGSQQTQNLERARRDRTMQRPTFQGQRRLQRQFAGLGGR